MSAESRKGHALQFFFFALLSGVLFGDTLFVPGRVAAEAVSDMRSQYLPWRQFAFDQIRAGRFPLWNPYSFCGTPFFGDPQSALLYPPNWLNLLLSPAAAANWLMALHFFLAGYLMSLWRRWRGSSVSAAILAGTIYACCGPIITNVRAGHLPLLCSAAWMPMLFWCVEEIFNSTGRRRWNWTLAGIAAVAMLALDGFPQFAYYTALGIGLYAIIHLPALKNRSRALFCVAVMFAGGWSISAVQILTSAQVASESIRASGISFTEAASYSLPPENLLTLIVPGLFGDAAHFVYYGRWYWGEACIFVGPAALALALYGAFDRRQRRATIMAVVMLALALGASTPLFNILYHVLPGFSSFRATNRFSLIGLLFLAILAGAGLDNFLGGEIQSRTRVGVFAGFFCAAAALLGLAAIWATNAENGGAGDFHRIIHALATTYQSEGSRGSIDPMFPAAAAHFAAGQLGMAALVTAITAALWVLAVRNPRPASLALAALAMTQLVYFGFSQRASSDAATDLPPPRKQAISRISPDDRVLLCNTLFADMPGLRNVGGYNPLVLGRMARFLAETQHDNPEEVGLNFPVHALPPAYRMLRCALVIPGRGDGAIYPIADPLPRLLLINQYTLAKDPAAALAAVTDTAFDPSRQVILESAPSPLPGNGLGGSVRILHETTDECEIEADLPSPRLLLVTDAYSINWRAVPLTQGDQHDYSIMPADYCLRAIPLTAGHHHFRMEYRPVAYVIGKWISIFSLAGFLASVVYSRTIHTHRRGIGVMPGQPSECA